MYFQLGTNPDLAAVNVQNRVSKAVSQIPQEVVQAGISTQKQQNSMIMVPLIYSTDSAYDEKFLENYTKINIIPEIQRVPGVGQAPGIRRQRLFDADMAEARPANSQ